MHKNYTRSTISSTKATCFFSLLRMQLSTFSTLCDSSGVHPIHSGMFPGQWQSILEWGIQRKRPDSNGIFLPASVFLLFLKAEKSHNQTVPTKLLCYKTVSSGSESLSSKILCFHYKLKLPLVDPRPQNRKWHLLLGRFMQFQPKCTWQLSVWLTRIIKRYLFLLLQIREVMGKLFCFSVFSHNKMLLCNCRLPCLILRHFWVCGQSVGVFSVLIQSFMSTQAWNSRTENDPTQLNCYTFSLKRESLWAPLFRRENNQAE